jgi:hypothetical protein
LPCAAEARFRAAKRMVRQQCQQQIAATANQVKGEVIADTFLKLSAALPVTLGLFISAFVCGGLLALGILARRGAIPRGETHGSTAVSAADSSHRQSGKR